MTSSLVDEWGHEWGKVKSKDARAALCEVCGVLPGNQYWGPSKTKGLHEGGTGHRVVLIGPKKVNA